MLTQKSCSEFTVLLASKKPIPGGGGAAALVAALGTALNTMVANFSKGKKKFIDFEKKHEDLIYKGEVLREKLVDLVDKDAECFEPLSKAYVLPSSTEEDKRHKNETLEKCLKNACSAPMEMIEYTYEAILLHKEIKDISSKNIISDVGVGVQCLKAALNSAYLNVLINLKYIEDEKYADENKIKISKLVNEGSKIADDIYTEILNIINE